MNISKLLFALVLTALFTFASCTKEETPEPFRTKVLGSYSVSESCSASNGGSSTDTYTSVISAGTTENAIIINDLFNHFSVNKNINATMTGENAFTIPNQEPDSDGEFISGTGTIDAAGKVMISFVYSVPSSSNYSESCTSTYTK